jgi:hypothetical protein
MIYTDPCIMFWMGWSFLGPKWHSPIGSMPFHRAQKTLNFQGPPPLAQVMDMHTSKTLCTGLYKSEVHRWFYAQEAHKGSFRAHTAGGGGAGE